MRHKSLTLLSVLALAVGGSALPNCKSSPSGTAGSTSSGTGAGGGGVVFQADGPAVYVAKVKNILVGLAPTDAEVKAVEADPSALSGLIDGWMTGSATAPLYQAKMERFFQLAFQQTQIDASSFIDMVPVNGLGPGAAVPLLVQNANDSFAHTVMKDIVTPDKDFTTAMTTTTVEMTTALVELYAFLDTYNTTYDAKNNQVIVDHLAAYNPTLATHPVMQGSYPMVTLADAADPTGPSFMQWNDPDVATYTYTTDPNCNGINPISYATSKTPAFVLNWNFYGAVYNHPDNETPAKNCGSHSSPGALVFTTTGATNDFNDWRPVTVRAPMPNEPITRFYDIETLRTLNELVIHTPRVGFFSTPAFQANWSTNTSNQFRVTTNQALIVATGAQVDGTDGTLATDTSAVDTMHVTNPACFVCHQSLDPTRAVLSDTWTYAYFTQEGTSLIPGTRQFAFQGVVQDVKTIEDFANILATHPLLPGAWVQKLCYYVNSQPCGPTQPGAPVDPEFTRLVGVFQQGFSWNALVKALLMSPLTINTTPTLVTQHDELVAVARRDHLCAALNNRLGFADICGLNVATPAPAKNSPRATILAIAGGLPSDGYGRGSTAPVLPNDPTLFFRSGLENICESVAQLIVDDTTPEPGTTPWSSTDPTTAINAFVATIMGITPSDPRSAIAVSGLTAHFNGLVNGTFPNQPATSKTDALRSTFTVACLTPSFAGIGM
jgi:hypothetical protein